MTNPLKIQIYSTQLFYLHVHNIAVVPDVTQQLRFSLIFTTEAHISKISDRPNGDPVILYGNDTTSFTGKCF